jgi:hypothetical protein
MKNETRPLVGIIMGSDSDWPTMEAAREVCREFGIPSEVAVVSAHRTPEDMVRYAKTAHRRGLRAIIAGAGGAAHLPGTLRQSRHHIGQAALDLVGHEARATVLQFALGCFGFVSIRMIRHDADSST